MMADVPPAPPASVAWHVSIESDMVAPALAGGSVWGFARPPRSPWRFGLGAASVVLPAGGGWSLRMSTVMGYAGVDLEPTPSTAFVGCHLGYWRDDFSLGTGTATLHNIAVLPAFGYRIALFEGLYLSPWLGLKAWVTLAGRPVVGGVEYPLPAVLPVPGCHLGYVF